MRHALLPVLLAAAACGAAPPRSAPRAVARPAVVIPPLPAPSACTVAREEPVGGMLSAGFLRALRDDVAPAVERAVCACAGPARLETPSELRVATDYVPSYGTFTGAGVDVGPDVGATFDWRGFEACVARSLDSERLTKRPLTGDVLPDDTPATVVMSLRVAVSR